MKLHKLILTILTLFISFQICSGQNRDSESNDPVDKYLNYFDLRFRFDRYSKEDFTKFTEKLELLKNSKPKDEWEGNYFEEFSSVGFSELRLNSDNGFVNFYIYTCYIELRYMDYGKIRNLPDVIEMLPQVGENSPRKATPIRYVKVKWGKRKYLVEESSLLSFAEKAAGLYVDPEDAPEENFQKWLNFWVNGDLEKDLVGLPVFPNAYKNLERLPVESKIISIDKRTFEKEKSFRDNIYTNSAFYEVTIDAGKNKRIKNGVVFEIPKTGEELFITNTLENTATGVIIREANDKQNDSCLNSKNKEIPCPKLKVSLKVKTSVGRFW